MQINKSYLNDAIGIARIMQAGRYKEVRVKGLDSHAIKALLNSRALLVKIKRDIENQIRGLLKNFGLVIGRAKQNTFTLRAGDLLENRPELAAAVEPLLRAREAVGRQIVELDGKVRRLARASDPVRRLMTAPGVRNPTKPDTESEASRTVIRAIADSSPTKPDSATHRRAYRLTKAAWRQVPRVWMLPCACSRQPGSGDARCAPGGRGWHRRPSDWRSFRANASRRSGW